MTGLGYRGTKVVTVGDPAFCDVDADHAGGDDAVLGPITLSDYDADRWWKVAG